LRIIEGAIRRVLVKDRKGMIEVELDDGTRKCIRADSRVTTDRGIISASDIRESDDIISFDVPDLQNTPEG